MKIWTVILDCLKEYLKRTWKAQIIFALASIIFVMMSDLSEKNAFAIFISCNLFTFAYNMGKFKNDDETKDNKE